MKKYTTQYSFATYDLVHKSKFPLTLSLFVLKTHTYTHSHTVKLQRGCTLLQVYISLQQSSVIL